MQSKTLTEMDQSGYRRLKEDEAEQLWWVGCFMKGVCCCVSWRLFVLKEGEAEELWCGVGCTACTCGCRVGWEDTKLLMCAPAAPHPPTYPHPHPYTQALLV